MFTSISARRWWRAGGALAITGLLMAASAQAAPIQFGGGTYTQNFDTLATSGNNNPWSNGSTLQGWYLFTMANAEVTTYRAGSGSAITAEAGQDSLPGCIRQCRVVCGGIESVTPEHEFQRGVAHHGVSDKRVP